MMYLCLDTGYRNGSQTFYTKACLLFAVIQRSSAHPSSSGGGGADVVAGRSRLTAHPGRLSATGVSSHLSVSALSVSSSAACSVSAAGGKSASGVSPAAVTHSPLDPNTVEQLRNNMQVCGGAVVVFVSQLLITVRVRYGLI